MDLECEFNPDHWAGVHIVAARPDGRGQLITAHVCKSDVEAWVAQLHRQDGHRLVSQEPMTEYCRPYGLCEKES
ncbi:hypothetical protein ABT354_11095 [Streptomyces sp. NPDC000594]|uniref:hypothetical protein n=1 Tax=Streptomyces sp. NPDC000594 TaxID=3154261 RepID=UPI0033324E69